MIAVRTQDGQLLRWIQLDAECDFLFTERLGLVSDQSFMSRARLRRQAGLAVNDRPLFRFRLEGDVDKFRASALDGCEVNSLSPTAYEVRSGNRVLRIEPAGATLTLPIAPVKFSTSYRRRAVATLAILAALLTIVLIQLGPNMAVKPEDAAKTEILDVPVAVKPLEHKVEPVVQQQALNPQQRVQKILTQNLGFLKTMGRKDLHKAIGGLPQAVANPTAGAGAGGGAGSGGQLLTGLGEGLRRTTVGNSGVAGLGGIGTKGAGGGLGGYGETGLGSGSGDKLAMVPLAREATIEGGLDRSLIQSTILRYLNQVRACYEEGLKRNPSLLGKVEMAFSINGEGHVPASRVARSSLPDAAVGDCIAHKMLNWQFPLPKGGVTVKVQYPFMLRPI